VFKITSAGVLTTLHSFAGFDGARPYAGVIQSSDGNFYGTTFGGDINSDYGTVFKITPSGLLTTLHSFSNSDGAYPIAGLIQGSDGNFYGSTSGGGSSDECKSYGCGTVFKLTVGGALTTLTLRYAEGAYPTGTLIQGNDGNYYGTSVAGGNRNCNAPDGCGTIFKITPEVTLMTVHTFDDGDGSAPYAGLLQATDGNFYGATAYGAIGYGTLFQLTPESTLTTLVGFTYADGSSPLGALVQDTSGNFYGTATGGGSSNDCGVNGCGTVFMLNMGLGPFAAFVRPYGKVGQTGGILGQGFTGTTSVSINGIRANFKVVSDTFIRATVPPGATTGYVTVVTTSVTLTSNVPFRVLQ
jgi:uncharacterized repeat protein (TIGR03803 family)